jgi:hypothetical protein
MAQDAPSRENFTECTQVWDDWNKLQAALQKRPSMLIMLLPQEGKLNPTGRIARLCALSPLSTARELSKEFRAAATLADYCISKCKAAAAHSERDAWSRLVKGQYVNVPNHHLLELQADSGSEEDAVRQERHCKALAVARLLRALPGYAPSTEVQELIASSSDPDARAVLEEFARVESTCKCCDIAFTLRTHEADAWSLRACAVAAPTVKSCVKPAESRGQKHENDANVKCMSKKGTWQKRATSAKRGKQNRAKRERLANDSATQEGNSHEGPCNAAKLLKHPKKSCNNHGRTTSAKRSRKSTSFRRHRACLTVSGVSFVFEVAAESDVRTIRAAGRGKRSERAQQKKRPRLGKR